MAHIRRHAAERWAGGRCRHYFPPAAVAWISGQRHSGCPAAPAQLESSGCSKIAQLQHISAALHAARHESPKLEGQAEQLGQHPARTASQGWAMFGSCRWPGLGSAVAQLGARGGTGSTTGAAGPSVCPSAHSQQGGLVSAPREHRAWAQGWFLYWGGPVCGGGSSCSLQTMSQ